MIPVDSGQDSSAWNDGAFGNTDAARVDLKRFISIPGVFTDPRQTPGSMQHRLVVGRKGSGKTMYLRVLQDDARRKDLLTLGEYELITTDLVIFFLKRIREYVYTMDRVGDLDIFVDRRKSIVSIWRLIWDRAILISIFSLCVNYFRQDKNRYRDVVSRSTEILTPGSIEELVNEHFSSIYKIQPTAISPQGAMLNFADFFITSRRLQSFLNDSTWSLLKRILSELVKHLPPIAIFIDAIDEEFENAPEAWLICQQGLYRSVIHSAHVSDSTAGRVHVITALRDIAYAAALRGEHATRNFLNRNIRDLEWHPLQIEEFFSHKLREMLSDTDRSSKIDNLINRWLGFDNLVNGRGKLERVSSYVIRHSRMLPRDIVLFGNAIAIERDRRNAQGKTFGHKSLRKAVSTVAKVICEESLDICINELLTSADYMENYVVLAKTVNPNLFDYRAYLQDKIALFFECTGLEVFGRESLRSSLIAAELCSVEDFEIGKENFYRFDNVLWRHGLLACLEFVSDKQVWRYNWKGSISADLLPEHSGEYGFHPCVMDKFKIQSCQHGPVI